MRVEDVRVEGVIGRCEGEGYEGGGCDREV